MLCIWLYNVGLSDENIYSPIKSLDVGGLGPYKIWIMD